MDVNVTAGEQFLEQKNYAAAYAKFLQAYVSKKSMRTNHLLFTAAFAGKQYADAYAIAADYLAEYIADDALFSKYLKAGVMAGKNINVVQLLILLTPYMTSAEKEACQQVVATTLTRYQQEHPETEKKWQYLGAYSVFEQRDLFAMAHALPTADFIAYSRQWLVDSNVHPILRASIVDDLRQLGVTEEVALINLNQEQVTVIPAQLPAVEQTEIGGKVLVSLQTTANEALVGEVRLRLQIMYPFVFKTLTSEQIQMIAMAPLNTTIPSENKLLQRLEAALQEWAV